MEKRYFAEIENGVVKRVIVAENIEWCQKWLGGEWVETFKDNDNHNFAAIGYGFSKEKKNFIPHKPHKLFELDDVKLQWKPPKEAPLKVAAEWGPEVEASIETAIICREEEVI